VNIHQQDSITECASIGAGYHLITNDEWMTIATNAAAEDSNWSGGSVGSGTLYRGHSDSSPNSKCAASTNDADAYVESSCTALASGGAEDDEATQRRTHNLSNGSVIWDLSGNVREWVNYFNDTDKPSNDGTPENGWLEYSLPVLGTTTMPLTDLVSQAAIDAGWDSTKSIGKYFPYPNNTSTGALIRGGTWGFDLAGGLFNANLNNGPTLSTTNLGLRCAVAMP
jgi:formylglycine-generating enzyme required for sulfatase activity